MQECLAFHGMVSAAHDVLRMTCCDLQDCLPRPLLLPAPSVCFLPWKQRQFELFNLLNGLLSFSSGS